MTTHTEQALTNLTESYNKLWLVDTQKLSGESMNQHLETLHRLSTDITVIETTQLKSVNDLLTQESSNLQGAIEQLSNTAVNDDIYSRMLIAVESSLKVIENLIPISF